MADAGGAARLLQTHAARASGQAPASAAFLARLGCQEVSFGAAPRRMTDPATPAFMSLLPRAADLASQMGQTEFQVDHLLAGLLAKGAAAETDSAQQQLQ